MSDDSMRDGSLRADADASLRLAGTLALSGGVLAAIGNLLHPIFGADISPDELMATVSDTWYWTPLHLLLGVGILLVVASFVVGAPVFRTAAARRVGQVAAVIGAISGALFAIQLAGIDGVAFRYLAARGADAAQVAVLQDLDVAMLSLSILTFMGVTAALFGVALHRDGRFPAWLGWLALVAGAGNVVTGLVQSFDGLSDLTITYLFRPLAAAVTVVLLGFGITARRLADRASEVRSPRSDERIRAS